MKVAEAVALIAGAIPARGGTWADLGAGNGTFTWALAELLGPRSRVHAVDRNSRAVAALRRLADREAPQVVPMKGDFTRPAELDELGDSLDGLLLANSLHYARDPGRVLSELATRLRSGGRVVLVEYDRHVANLWVPHPIPVAALPQLTSRAGLTAPSIVARRPSAYGGDLYVAVADRP